MDSRITVRFYRVEPRTAEQPEFGECLEELLDKDPDELTAIVGDLEMGVLDFAKTGTCFSGDLARHQKENLPTLLQKKQKPKRLTIPKGGALGHHTAFRFDEKTGILAYQLTRNSVPMSSFNLYVAQTAGCDTFHFLPVLSLPKLKELSTIKGRTLLIKIADPHDLEAVEDDQKELQDSLIALKDFANGAYVRVQVGLGKTKGELDKGVIKGTVGWLLEQWAKKRGEIKTLKLTGKPTALADGEDDTTLDFLRAHLGETESLPLKGVTPQQSYKIRSQFVKRVMTQHSATLKAVVKST